MKDVGSATQKTTQKILELIIQNPGIIRKDLVDQLDIRTDGVNYHLDKIDNTSNPPYWSCQRRAECDCG